MAAEFPALNVVLFDVDGDNLTKSNKDSATGGQQDSSKDSASHEKTSAAEWRRESMKHILDTVLGKQLPNLFFLCQDSIDKKKLEILVEKLGHESAVLPDSKTTAKPAEAGVYYASKPSQGVGYNVEFVSAEILEKVELSMLLTRYDPFVHLKGRTRLVACVLTPKGGAAGSKILLVSWHGPHKTKHPDAAVQTKHPDAAVQRDSKEAKRICFKQLVDFLDRLKQDQSCHVVIIGGDYNWPAREARKELDSIGRLEGVVAADYTTTTDRQYLRDRGMTDYIVYWPKDNIQQITAKVECGNYRRKRPRPFDHPVVRYQVKLKDLATTVAGVSVSDPRQRENPSATQPSSTSMRAADSRQFDNTPSASKTLSLLLLFLSLDAHLNVDDCSGTLGGVRKVHISALVTSP